MNAWNGIVPSNAHMVEYTAYQIHVRCKVVRCIATIVDSTVNLTAIFSNVSVAVLVYCSITFKMLRAAIHPLKNQIIVDCTKHRFSTKTQCDLGRFAKLMRRSSHKDSKLYVASTDIANQIINSISKYRNASVPFIEFNPGPCVLTRQIIRQMPASRLVLVEENAEFQQSQKVDFAHFAWKCMQRLWHNLMCLWTFRNCANHNRYP